jgi:hypothetical protein
MNLPFCKVAHSAASFVVTAIFYPSQLSERDLKPVPAVFWKVGGQLGNY